MTPIAITGVGVVSPIGVGEAEFWTALISGRSAITRLPDGEDGSRLRCAARVGEFGARQAIAPAQLRRMPRLAQMSIVAAKQAIAAAALDGIYPGARLGVIAGTGLGNVDDTMAFTRGFVERGAEGASPLLFPMSVMNAVAGQLALECSLLGVNITVNHRDHSALGAVALACDMLELGRADALVVIGFDELSPPVEHGYLKMGGVSPRALRPYDTERDGLVPGEGAAALLLEREVDARRRGARVRARITGRAESSDHRPRVGWGPLAGGPWREAARAVREATCAAHRPIGWIAGSGNGTRLDERELATLAEALPRLAPLSSILGQTGEFFASGMLRILAGVGALTAQTIPGTVGLVRAAPKWAEWIRIASAPSVIEAVLVPSFAQGGANGVLLLERPE